MGTKEWTFEITEKVYNEYHHLSIDDFVNTELSDAKAIKLNMYGIIGGYFKCEGNKYYAVVTTYSSCD